LEKLLDVAGQLLGLLGLLLGGRILGAVVFPLPLAIEEKNYNDQIEYKLFWVTKGMQAQPRFPSIKSHAMDELDICMIPTTSLVTASLFFFA